MKKLALLSLLLLPLACTDMVTEPSILEAPVAEAPVNENSSAPTMSGIVVRGEFMFGFTWVDHDAGLRIVVGYDQADACRGAADLEIFSFQNVDVRPGRRVNGIDGEVQTSVWGFTDFDCGRFTAEEPIAEGLSTVRGQTNDLFGSGEEAINSTTVRAIGELTWTAGGGSARLSAFYRILTREGGILTGAPPVESRVGLR